jgi:hypothetical protein
MKGQGKSLSPARAQTHALLPRFEMPVMVDVHDGVICLSGKMRL